MQRRIHGDDADHADLASLLHAIGNVLDRKGDYGGALERFQSSLEMERRIHGDDADHAGIASLLHAIGKVLFSKGD